MPGGSSGVIKLIEIISNELYLHFNVSVEGIFEDQISFTNGISFQDGLYLVISEIQRIDRASSDLTTLPWNRPRHRRQCLALKGLVLD